MTHADDYRNHWTEDGQQSLAKALQLAESAMRIDPDIPEVYAVLGYAHAVRLDYKNAIRLVGKAIELDRSDADAYAYLGAFYTHSGEPAKAIPLLRTAMRLNPDAGFIYFVVPGRAYLFQGDFQQAAINLKEAVKRNATDLETRPYMTATLVATGGSGGRALGGRGGPYPVARFQHRRVASQLSDEPHAPEAAIENAAGESGALVD